MKSIAKENSNVRSIINLGETAVSDSRELLFGDKNKYIQRYNPSLILSHKGFEVIDKMRRDDQVKAALKFKKNTVVSTGWEIVSPEGKPEDWVVTEFVRKNIKQLKGTFERRILDLLSALEYGYSINEMTFERKQSSVYLRSLKTKKPHDFDFYTDPYGNLTGIEQMGLALPINKFIVYSYDSEFDNPHGNTDLEAAYRAWWTKDSAYKWFAMLLERMGIPPIFVLYDSSAYKGTDLAALQGVVENLQAATTATIPTYNDKDRGKSIEFWAPELADNIDKAFMPTFDMLNRDIARALLMPGLLGMTPDDSVGSHARSRVHFDVFMLVIEQIRSEVQEHIMNEQLIKSIVDMNFVTDEYPEFKFLPITDDARTDLLTTWKDLLNVKAVKSTAKDESHIRKLLKFPEREESDEIIVDEEGLDGDSVSGVPNVDGKEEPKSKEKENKDGKAADNSNVHIDTRRFSQIRKEEIDKLKETKGKYIKLLGDLYNA